MAWFALARVLFVAAVACSAAILRPLPVGLRCDQDVHPKLEARRLVHDLVAAARCSQALDRIPRVEGAHGPTLPRHQLFARRGWT